MTEEWSWAVIVIVCISGCCQAILVTLSMTVDSWRWFVVRGEGLGNTSTQDTELLWSTTEWRILRFMLSFVRSWAEMAVK